ncbi:HET-domain-containing protein [Xylaria arbuscula]|nr:HET-domain-containing protein [Xylaria arbuscula]
MRLLNVRTRELKEFFGHKTPKYAILSHTWEEEEVTFEDLKHPQHQTKTGYYKIDQTCKIAAREGFDWVWVDTCCIDKSSSAELSEAINSMFDWYYKASICYVFLADVPPPTKPTENLVKTIYQARWFTRGWTLQEYLASSKIVLLNSAWQPLCPGNFPTITYDFRTNILHRGLSAFDFVSHLLTCITGINASRWQDASTATRLLEDEAYCLLGILDVKMPLLYGEGSQAFSRLLGELIKKSNSHDVLAAWYGLPQPDLFHVLPTSPRAYAGCAREFKDVQVGGKPASLHFTMTNAGLNIELPLIQIDSGLKLVLDLAWITLFFVSLGMTSPVCTPLQKFGNTAAPTLK